MAVLKTYDGQLAAKLNPYISRGRDEARKGRPPSSATAPDHNESELRSEAEGWLSSELTLFSGKLSDISKASADIKQRTREFEHTCDQLLQEDTAVGAVRAELAGIRPRLVNSARARIRAETEYNYFRETNLITEEANYPESKLWHFAMLALFALAEVMANAFFFENSEGLLGGFVVALGIAVVNIGTAMVLGLLFRHKNLASTPHRFFGWVMAALCVVLVLFCNALFASFRSAYQVVADPSDAAQLGAAFRSAWPQAMGIFKLDMAFRDHWSFLLFGIGLLLSGLAFWKGYTLEDPYPGYGRKDRTLKAAVAVEEQDVAAARMRVRDMFHQRRTAVQAALAEPAALDGLLLRRISELELERELTIARADAIRRDCATVVGAYRNANQAVSARPAPAYFRDPVELTTVVSLDAAEPLLVDMRQHAVVLKTLTKEKREPLNLKVNSYQASESEVLTGEISTWLSEIRTEAEKSVDAVSPHARRAQAVRA